jgi:hypothetical protein
MPGSRHPAVHMLAALATRLPRATALLALATRRRVARPVSGGETGGTKQHRRGNQ